MRISVRRHRTLLSLTVGLASLLAACDDESSRGATDSLAADGTFVGSACVMPLPAGQASGNVRCGSVTLPQNPETSDGMQVKLAVAILTATGEEPQPDPLLIINGGPGIPTLTMAMQAFTKEFAQPLQSRRDLVFVDHRGTGLSTPSLDCPEQRARYREALAAGGNIDYEGLSICAERLARDGVRLSDYHSAAIARDMTTVMGALGYEQWNIYGWSYGTRVTLTALRDAPERIRSVVLDSTVPLEADVQSSVSANFGAALLTLSEDCTADARCGDTYPGLQLDALRSARAKLEASPVVVKVDDAALGDTASVLVNGASFREFVLSAMYDVRLIPALPAWIAAVNNGDTTVLRPLVQQTVFDFDSTADAMFFAVLCNEELPFDDPGTFRQSPCGRLDLASPNSIEDASVRSDVRALILAGSYDPITPPDYGRLVGSALPNSTLTVFPYEAHGVLLNLHAMDGETPSAHACAARVIAAFLDAETDTAAGCIEKLPPPLFNID